MITPTYISSTSVSGVERYRSDQITPFSSGAVTSCCYDLQTVLFCTRLYEMFFSRKLIKRVLDTVFHCLLFYAFLENIQYTSSLGECNTVLQSSGISFYGFTWDSRAWIFPSSSLILSSFFWDSAWASCRALNSSSNCKKRDTRMTVCTDVNTHTSTHTQVGERHGVSRKWPQGTSTDTKTRRLTLSGRFLFIAPMALEPCCPLSLFQAWLSSMLMDLTFAETKPCRYNDFTGPAGCTVDWWDRTLEKKTQPGPPRCRQTAVARLLKIYLNIPRNMLEVRF